MRKHIDKKWTSMIPYRSKFLLMKMQIIIPIPANVPVLTGRINRGNDFRAMAFVLKENQRKR